MSDFFDLPDEAFTKKATTSYKEDENIYDPSPDKYNGSYKSVFRFIPYIHDKKLSRYTKYSAKIWNPLTKEKLIIDCPSNTGEPSFLWTLDIIVNSFKKTEPTLFDELKQCFQRWYTNMAPIYIKKDPQRPELEDHVKFLKYRSHIDKIIEGQLNPETVDGLIEQKKINPFHMLNGKDFLCVVSKKTKIFRDWDKCKFMDDITPLMIKTNGKNIIAANNPKVIKAIGAFLTENTPKIDEYLHVEWTDETYQKVAEALVGAIPHKTVLEMAIAKSRDQKMNALLRELLDRNKTNSSVFPEDTTVAFTNSKESTEVAAKVTETASDSTGDEYDDLFKDL